ncbi:MAG: sugar phosphate isomerase/epimerase [Candidatus Omnitrophica bacterium]|nr:sugar phosphate isomerase/epimerase [Candidatus Omnitrophota bacterium]
MYLTKQNFLIQAKYAGFCENEAGLEESLLGFGAELYMRSSAIEQYDAGIIKRIRLFIEKNRLPLQLHAPIVPLDYSLYEKVVRLCKELNINTIVSHREASDDVFLWKEISLLLARSGLRVNLENHCEGYPDSIVELYKRINLENVGLCIDPGHVNVFGKIGILEWLEKYPQGALREVHLADNEGDRDTHLPLGRGNIDIKAVFKALEKRNEKIVFVLEPKKKIEAKESLIFLRKNGFLG